MASAIGSAARLVLAVLVSAGAVVATPIRTPSGDVWSPREAQSLVQEDATQKHTDGIINKILFLNLDDDVKRREHMYQELNAMDPIIPFKRIPAVKPKNLNNRELIDFDLVAYKGCCVSYGRKSCPTTLANLEMQLRSCSCDFAHRRAYQEIANSADGLYLVVEDDVYFQPGWQQKFSEAYAQAPDDWNILRLGFWGDSNEADRVNNGSWFRSDRYSGGDWPDFKGYFGAHAIVLTPQKAQNLLSAIQYEPLSYADNVTASGQINGYQINSYVLAECLVCVGPESELPSSRWVAGTDAPEATETYEIMGPEAWQTALEEAAKATEQAAATAAAAEPPAPPPQSEFIDDPTAQPGFTAEGSAADADGGWASVTNEQSQHALDMAKFIDPGHSDSAGPVVNQLMPDMKSLPEVVSEATQEAAEEAADRAMGAVNTRTVTFRPYKPDSPKVAGHIVRHEDADVEAPALPSLTTSQFEHQEPIPVAVPSMQAQTEDDSLAFKVNLHRSLLQISK